MLIVRRVRIKYFRSVYDASLSNCGGLNIISGRNDAGKSNVLRALHLFFNGQADWQTPLDFYRDFSLQRLEQVRKESVKGKQFIQVLVEFQRPLNYKGSLPERFNVTRTWFRDQPTFSESNNIQGLFRQGKCPGSEETAQRFLQIFLNRIHFEYVPAVKDRAFFTHLLSRLQTSLLAMPLDDKNPVTPLAESLAAHIGGQVGELQADFKRATGLETSIEPPSEFASLFQAFAVSTPSGDEKIPLVLRGDGLQSRYVPSVLHYIASKSNRFFIWGIEEPENSLEYSHADALADDFETTYSREVQIFLTSHSPAFVSRKDPKTACFRAYQVDSRTNVVRLVRPLDSTPAGVELLGEIGLIRVQEEIHARYKSSLNELSTARDRIEVLEAEVATHKKPLVLVEGVTDKAILDVAWGKLKSGQMPFVIRPADPLLGEDGGSGGATTLRNVIESIHPEDGRKVIAIFDHDAEGTKWFNNLSKTFKKVGSQDFVRRRSNGVAASFTLASLGVRSDYVKAKNLSIEFLFQDDTLSARTEDGRGLKFTHSPVKGVVTANGMVGLSSKELRAIGQALGDLLPYRKIEQGKNVFAEEIVPSLPQGAFSSFEKLFAKVDELLLL